MAPDAPEPQPPRLAAPQAGHGSAQASGAGPVSSRVPLRWPDAKRPEPPRPPEPTSPSSESSTNGDSDDESEDDRGHGFLGRGHGEKNHSGEGSASDEVSPAGQPSPELGGSQNGEHLKQWQSLYRRLRWLRELRQCSTPRPDGLRRCASRSWRPW